MSNLQKVSIEYFYADWILFITDSRLERLIWTFSPGHTGVIGNERIDSLAGDAAIDNNQTLDPPTVIQCGADQLAANRLLHRILFPSER